MSWDLTGSIVRGVYLDRHTFSGKVVASRVAYGGRVIHTVELFVPIVVFGEKRNRLQIDDKKILAAA